MITTPPETSSARPNAEIIIIDLDNEDINHDEGINLEGHLPLGLEGYAEFLRLIRYIFPYLVIKGPPAKSMLTLNL